MNAADPQNDREWLLKLNGQIENLSNSINGFSQTIRDIEEKKIAAIEERLDAVEGWKSKLEGGWKFAVIICTIFGAAAGHAIKKIWP